MGCIVDLLCNDQRSWKIATEISSVPFVNAEDTTSFLITSIPV